MSQAPSIITELIDRFEQNRESYKNQGYNETQLRREFLDPFFGALGWDVANRQGHAEAYKDVVHEDAIKIGGNTKAPDYCFRIGGARKFFLEAKKPAVNVKDEIPPAYQLRRYAWSAKLPLSILTDFEEFAVYDCRTRPTPSDKPSVGRILYLTYRDYLARWDEIASIFSKEAVLKGSFDKYAVTDRKRGTATVDAEFLKEIETWREALAKNLALRNPNLSVHELNFSVQRTIDRLIFLRIAEDRGIEPYAKLQTLLSGSNIYGSLRYLFQQADDRYNSGLFHFQSEKGRAETPDELTPGLKIDDKTLKDIIGRLYYPNSPYEFSVFPTEILGQVYEQFLGKVIRLTSAHQAKVEEKPEVKKAGGVYYTPAYIVEYIVKQTVGALCDGKTPKQVAKLTVLDPACGSGSFLIGAYQYLLNYYRDWYMKNGPEKHRKELFQTTSGEWRLTTQEKKRILLNNIYGVDIDSQAVEVTKLSLLLKVLEGESDETMKRQLSFVHERALPDLSQNIKCGNSLIGPDYFTGQLMPDNDELRRVNPFDWKAEFPEIMKAGGFDAVIGNPPYVRVGNIDEVVLPYLYEHYDVTHRFDIYVVFVLKAYQVLSGKGRLGFILPNKFFTADYGKKLRAFLASRKAVQSVVDFGDAQVFGGASTYTCLLFLNREQQETVNYLKASPDSLAVNLCAGSAVEVAQVELSEASWSFLPETSSKLLRKFNGYPKLGDLCEIERGLETGCDEVFFLYVSQQDQSKDSWLVTSKVCNEPFKIEKSAVRLLVKGSADVQRYSIESDRALVFPYQQKDGKPILIEAGLFAHEFPLAWKYLNNNSQRLKGRGKVEWYAFRRRNYDLRDGISRILVPSIGKRLSAAMDAEGVYHFVGSGGGGGGSYGLVLKGRTQYSACYILGLLNSKLLDWLAKLSNSRFGGGYYSFNRQYIEPIPIRPIDFTNFKDKSFHDQIVFLVERMCDSQGRALTAKTTADKDRLQRQIDATDQEIDRLVYDLYGMTEEEIQIVEACGEPGRTTVPVASMSKVKENDSHESEIETADRLGSGRRPSAGVAEAAQYTGEGGGGASESVAGAGESVHGVREPAGQYGSSQNADESEGQGELGSTRYFDTAEGRISYSELSERLAVPLVAIHDEILQTKPHEIVITSEWLCLRHRRLAGHLFPDWAGRFRDVNVQVGAHIPPPFYEVPIHMRQFSDDLAERLRHNPGTSIRSAAEFLAWADWRFQWIHPFKDFNGRIGRVLLAALLYMLSLPHVETAPPDRGTRERYLDVLRSADQGNYDPLTLEWLRRLEEAL
ncbi:MAG: N-6 DNA methylase [Nitrospira sp.]|nr:N-6 DNA methylase [Nitrospira sp.]MDH4356776.1 N-6 DNA methylase [Nitrospira sp.]MDH5319190.1 N-6 DNA methylase [Nitrospira sp.]